MDTQWMIMIGVVLVVIILAVAFTWIYAKKMRSQRLKAKFGPEYHRVVQQMSSREIAEDELEKREQRVRRFNIVPLSPKDRSSYQDRWTNVQERFVDDPKGAVEEAHELIDEVMKKRGYPVADVEHSAANLSVEYPAVITHYLTASLIAENNRKGRAQTEELRQAVVNYRALFEELLEVTETPRTKARIELNRIFRGGLRT